MKHKPTGPKKIRLSLELQPHTNAVLDRLTDLTHSASTTETIRRAITVYDMIVFHVRGGGQILMKHKSGKTDTLIIL